MLKIGITETYEPSYDMRWTENLKDINFIITKNLTDELITNIVTLHRSGVKFLLHATCTGWGGEFLEPNVPSPESYKIQLEKLLKLGFPKSQIVLRTDPIIPSRAGFAKFVKVLRLMRDLEIKRVRLSVMDLYPHVYTRLLGRFGDAIETQEIFEAYSLRPDGSSRYFNAKKYWFDKLDQLCAMPEFKNYEFESCGEKFDFLYIDKIGCVSEKDLSVFGLKRGDLCAGGNRLTCSCLNKEQIIPGGMSRGRCPNQCIYCYLRDR